jgi:multidrug efflux pump subunit AcrA (membrane-fusion protein)
VDEACATQVALNQSEFLQLTEETDTRQGHVSCVSPPLDVDTGGLAVKMAFDRAVKAPVSLTVSTNVIVERSNAALSIPRTALPTGMQDPGIFVIEDGMARLRPVTVIDWPAARLIVTAGLAVGDVVMRMRQASRTAKRSRW